MNYQIVDIKKMKFNNIRFLILILFFTSCNSYNEYKKNLYNYNDPNLFHDSMQKLTDLIVYDIFSPPVASRIYVYPSIAAYEVLLNDYPEYKSFSNQLNGLGSIPKPNPDKEYSFPLASIHAFLTVGKDLIFSKDKMTEFQKNLFNDLKSKGMPKDIYKRSIQYGDKVASHIKDWYSSDNYKETRSYPKFTVQRDKEDTWKPTPPDYMDGIEPHWSKIRTLAIDSSNQFIIPPPPEFNLDKNSKFFKDLYEVYEIGNNLTEEQTNIANFWDCNPYVSNHIGHAMFATKKITPGGHWIGITQIASKKAELNLMESIYAYALVSIGLFDSFIVCWDEKYRSILVRPETLINQYIDEDWIPVLQTPPFPEYTSGHSVISRSAANILTFILGDNFNFLDTTEEIYGLPARNYDSFLQASDEAAISRLWGGIHYMPAITNGIDQGDRVSKFIIKNLDVKSNIISKN